MSETCDSDAIGPLPRELPASAVTGRGWLGELFSRQESGLTGHPREMGFPFDGGLWAELLDNGKRQYPQYGEAWWPYEQSAYYLDGALRCGHYLGSSALLGRVRESVEHILKHRKSGGRLGPLNVEADAWPMVIFTRMLLEEYESSGDGRVIDALQGHYAAVYGDGSDLETMKLIGFAQRPVLHVENLCRLAELTGQSKYAALARRIYDKFAADNVGDAKTADSMRRGVVSGDHAVSYHEFLKLPAVLFHATGDESMLSAARGGFDMLERHHELADGLASGFECLSGNADDLVHETCNAGDFVLACGHMLRATGEVRWADKLEKAFFNAGLGSVSRDFRSHQYYSSPNQAILSNRSSHWNGNSDWGQYAFARMCYRPAHDTECCTGNVHRLAPAFAKRMFFFDSARDEITAALYAPCEARFTLSGGQALTLSERTEYPFGHRIEFCVGLSQPRDLRLRLRVPHWSGGYCLSLNGRCVDEGNAGGRFVLAEAKFRDGDCVLLELRPHVVIRRRPRSMSLEYGPLVFSLPIVADVRRATGGPKCSAEFPAYEHLPRSEWNYALPADLTPEQVDVVRRPKKGSPWDEDNSPLVLRVSGRRVVNWTLREGLYTPPIPDTLDLDGRPELLHLVPQASTLLRITEFPRGDF
ncbi:MAG: beta-L-arabinofuranosidase domain-containing protein [Planctomycetaceae bacterium]|nr:glycoside hydrolase family 127 protein [Planctomycetaceae bacterium]